MRVDYRQGSPADPEAGNQQNYCRYGGRLGRFDGFFFGRFHFGFSGLILCQGATNG